MTTIPFELPFTKIPLLVSIFKTVQFPKDKSNFFIELYFLLKLIKCIFESSVHMIPFNSVLIVYCFYGEVTYISIT
jgi:hypothetical protein